MAPVYLPGVKRVIRAMTKQEGADLAKEALDAAGVRLLPFGPDSLRAVTSLMVSSADIAAALAIVESVLCSRP